MNEYDAGQRSPIGLDVHGLSNLKNIYWNLSTPALYEEALKRNEGIVAHLGPLVVRTGQFTGRSPNDKFIVDEPTSHDHVWWGNVNRPFAPEHFDELHRRMASYLQSKDVFIQDCWAGADPDYRMPVRIITQYAWHSLFARNMFIQAKPEELSNHKPEFVVIDCPGFHAFPEHDKTNSDVFILVNFAKKLVLIGGTEYAGEIKKSVFTAMNYFLPFEEVMPMHCSANYGAKDDTALFFGLSGTGKTTLSADSSRTLIGDDEHGWSSNGIFNFEGGCYAKTIRLSAEDEPEIYETTRRFGTILENIGINTSTRRVDLDDGSLTENTRAAYPISHIPNATRDGRGDHPKDVIFLTADAFGVLPPIAKLTPEQAMYHFISGYTAKVAGTERGVTEPQATFSACFGAPFMAQHPSVYAELVQQGSINQATADQHPYLGLVGLVGSIDNDMFGTDMTIGADTALHRITEAIDAIGNTAASHHRCFVVEVMGRHCGYLALMSGLATGAEQVYLHENGVKLAGLQADLAQLIEGFSRGKRLGLMIRNEKANDFYTTGFMCSLFEEEGGNLFDVRQAILGHLQQGGDPSPFDRTQATRLARRCIEFMIEVAEKGDAAGVFVGLQSGQVEITSLDELSDLIDAEFQRPKQQWWLGLQQIAKIMAKPDQPQAGQE